MTRTNQMTGQMGAKIVDVLEQAGELYLGLEPKIYQAFLLQVGATDALRRYDRTEAYWERLQAVLDGFFTSAERAKVCERLVDRFELCARAEFRSFLCRARAERQLQDLIRVATAAVSAPAQIDAGGTGGLD
jgi:hypothetical protein